MVSSLFRLRIASSLPISLVAALSLTACLLDPQASREPQAQAGDVSTDKRASVLFRVALPESAIGQVDSAEVRMRVSDGTWRAWPIVVCDSVLQGEVSGLGSGQAEFEVLAFASGQTVYSGSLVLDPSQAGAAAVTVSLGRVGLVRIDGRFEDSGVD